MRLVASIPTMGSSAYGIMALGIFISVVCGFLFILACSDNEIAKSAIFAICFFVGLGIIVYAQSRKDEVEYRYICEDPTLTVRELEEKYIIVEPPTEGYWVLKEKETP